MIDKDDADQGDAEVSIGLLLEIAQTHQQLVEAALARLKEHTAGLDAVVREQIRRTLIDELRGVHFESERAVNSLRRARKAADLRIVVWSVGIAALSAMVAAVVGYGTAHLWRELARFGMHVHR